MAQHCRARLLSAHLAALHFALHFAKAMLRVCTLHALPKMLPSLQLRRLSLLSIITESEPDTRLLHGCRGFCEVVLSDNGDFLRRYHGQRGDDEISITSWHAHPGMGEVREVKFLTHTKVTVKALS